MTILPRPRSARRSRAWQHACEGSVAKDGLMPQGRGGMETGQGEAGIDQGEMDRRRRPRHIHRQKAGRGQCQQQAPKGDVRHSRQHSRPPTLGRAGRRDLAQDDPQANAHYKQNDQRGADCGVGAVHKDAPCALGQSDMPQMTRCDRPASRKLSGAKQDQDPVRRLTGRGIGAGRLSQGNQDDVPSDLKSPRSIADHNLSRRSRKALPMTLTDDNAIAAAAMTGDSRMPKAG